jgi:transposase
MVAEGRAERIGADESRRLTHKRGGMCCLIVARTTYRTTTGGESTLATTAMPREIFTRALATPSLIAHIITQKYAMGLPLYRLEEQFARQGCANERSHRLRSATSSRTTGTLLQTTATRNSSHFHCTRTCAAPPTTTEPNEPLPFSGTNTREAWRDEAVRYGGCASAIY